MLEAFCNANVILVLVWAIADSVWRWFRYDGRKDARHCNHRYWGAHYYVGIAGLAFWHFQIGEIALSHSMVPIVIVMGTALCWLGWLFTWWSRRCLASSWSASAYPVLEKVQNGPYSYFSHPIYVGETIMFLGLGLFSRNIIFFLLVFIGLTSYNYVRARCEAI